MNNKIKHYLKTNDMLSQYGRNLISQDNKVKKAYEKPFFKTKKQTMVSKEEVTEMIDFAINQHNRNAGQISMVLGFAFMALFADGLFRTLGLIPPFMGIDVSIVKEVVEAIKDQVITQA
jgi:predicted PolB exonuclease-like 3'-5' exonuclease